MADHYLHDDILPLIPRLERYARALTRDPARADDLVQECLARALEKVHLWQPGTDLRAWLFTILHNQHISRARREARHRESVELQKIEARPDLPPNQNARLELRDLERGLAKLPKDQRSVILLIGLEGMGYAEAAAIVNSPIGTVRSRVARGRESLRKLTGMFPGRHSEPSIKTADRDFPQRSRACRKPRTRTQSASPRKTKQVVA